MTAEEWAERIREVIRKAEADGFRVELDDFSRQWPILVIYPADTGIPEVTILPEPEIS